MQHCTFTPRGVCAFNIEFDLDGNIVRNVSFTGGCNGNLKAIGKLVEGMTVDDIESRLKGNDCNGRGTSCADQFAIAVRSAYDKLNA